MSFNLEFFILSHLTFSNERIFLIILTPKRGRVKKLLAWGRGWNFSHYYTHARTFISEKFDWAVFLFALNKSKSPNEFRALNYIFFSFIHPQSVMAICVNDVHANAVLLFSGTSQCASVLLVAFCFSLGNFLWVNSCGLHWNFFKRELKFLWDRHIRRI